MLLLWSTFYSGPGMTQEPLRIAAASDLRATMPGLIEQFKDANPQLEIQVIYGSSGRFSGQIRNGAPFDLFLSADIDYPQQLRNQNQNHGTVYPYASGALALWHGRASEPTRDDLYQARRIAIANPQHAPYGRLAKDWLKQLAQWPELEAKLVYAESAAQVAHMVRSGGADIGISALSVLSSRQLYEFGRYQAISPKQGYTPLLQGMMITARGQQHPHADAFRCFLLGEGQRTLQLHGLLAPSTPIRATHCE